MLAMVFIIGAVGSASALSSYYSSFTSTYPSSATASFSCEICHVPAGPPNRNPYGAAYASAGHSFSAIEGQDSDGDGATNIAEINAGTNPGDPGSTPAPAPVACTGYTYSAWSACSANGQQTRTVTGNTPSGCTGTPSTAAVLTQSCTPAPVACTAYTYSAWSSCQPNNTQTRTVTSSSPAGCTGSPSASMLTQACTYVPPVMMPMPTSPMVFSSAPTTDPVIGSGPQDTMPIGVGSVATGGNMLTIHVEVGQFQMPMDMYFELYAPSLDPFNVYLLDQQGALQPASMMTPWMTGLTSIDQMPFRADIPTSMLPPGTYSLGLMATPSGGDMSTYYLWVTSFVIQ